MSQKDKGFMNRYADVMVPLPLQRLFTYEIPDTCSSELQLGSRVIVSFGPTKFYTAVVVRTHDTKPDFDTKPVLEVLDEHPIVFSAQLKFWEWIADYYMCTQGEVMKAALPSGLKLESETLVVRNDDYEAEAPLSAREQRLLDAFGRHAERSLTQLAKDDGRQDISGTVKVLLERGAIQIKEEVKRNYKPRTETCVTLADGWLSEPRLQVLFDELKRSKQQLHLLKKYLELSRATAALTLANPSLLKEVVKKELREAAGVSASVCSALEQRGVLRTYTREVGRLENGLPMDIVPLNPLSAEQQTAYEQIRTTFESKAVCLLHGVTSSGKTEVYIHLIQDAVKNGKQVLYLLPEIVLTTQLTKRLKRVFGKRLGIYHSKYPDAERVELWQKQLSEQPYDIIVGVRSSVFLPFRNLGLVIVDEEHEATYKQQDPAPRYHARNVAMVLAAMYGARTLLGTATPSAESYYNATVSGKYGLVQLATRYRNVLLPQIEVVDIKELQHKRRMKGAFSPLLLEKMETAMASGEQIILFQNRRGFAPLLECHTCGWVPRCTQCDVSLTYHKGLNQLTCHYCGRIYKVPERCPACEGTELLHKGYGTEKIEDEIRTLFPRARVARMDLDTTRTRKAYEQIIADFQAGRTDILVGTQMVTKGLDFERVSVVGILNADTLLNYPDFRSYERAYQMMAQVAGRAGRRNRQGLVVLQTKTPDIPLIAQVVANDFRAMFADLMDERKLFSYPPSTRLVYMYMKHKDVRLLDSLAIEAASRLRLVFGERILGPDTPPVGRVQLLFIRKLVVKMELGASMNRVRGQLAEVRRQLLADERYRSVQIYFDVDPL